LMDIRIHHFEPFKEVYGFLAGDDVLRFTAMLMGEVVDEAGTPNDFIGHPGGDNFIIITTEETSQKVQSKLKTRFAEEVLSHYNFMDRDLGYIMTTDKDGQSVQKPLMTLAVGVVSPSQYEFADIREITELAAEARRQNS
jgi:GGDEF domain-containing protein